MMHRIIHSGGVLSAWGHSQTSKVVNREHLSGWEKSIEQFDGLVHSGFKSSKAGDDADISPMVAKLPERYERGEFHPHVHFTMRDRRFDAFACCGVFANAHQLPEVDLGSLLGSGRDDGRLPMLRNGSYHEE